MTDFDITLAEKAITEDSNGDLVIEGIFASWEKDREGWMFQPDSFQNAIKSFMATGSQPLLVQHDPKLGQFGVIEEMAVKSNGAWLRARIPEPADGSPLKDWYNKVKRGMTRGLSVRGPSLIRKLRDGTFAARIQDIVEVSVTPAPVNTGGVLAVAQKAMDSGEATVEEEPPADNSEAIVDYFRGRLEQMTEALDRLEKAVGGPDDAGTD